MMNNLKVLVVTFLISTQIVNASEVEYALSGQDAVLRLEKTGECVKCDLSGQNLTRAFAILKKEQKKINVAGSDLSSSICTGASWKGGNFSETILDDAILFDVETHDTNFTKASMNRVRMVSPVLAKSTSDKHVEHPNNKLYVNK